MKHKLALLLIALLTIGVFAPSAADRRRKEARRKVRSEKKTAEREMTIDSCEKAFEKNVKDKLKHAGYHTGTYDLIDFFREQIIPKKPPGEKDISQEAIIQCHTVADDFKRNIDNLKDDMDQVQTVFRDARAKVPLEFIEKESEGGTKKPVELRTKWFTERFPDITDFPEGTADACMKAESPPRLLVLCCATIALETKEKCATSDSMGVEGFSFKNDEDPRGNRVICHAKYA